MDDAGHATKAAVEEGIVAGGGTALLVASRALSSVKTANNEQKLGLDIVARAIQAPIRQIASNAGKDSSIIVNAVLTKGEKNFGYDAQNDSYGDMIQMGIIDPKKVVRLALQNAASIASLIATTEAVVADKPEKTESGPQMPQSPGMGGMGMPGMM